MQKQSISKRPPLVPDGSHLRWSHSPTPPSPLPRRGGRARGAGPPPPTRAPARPPKAAEE
eukprot:8134353-Alexandrium_andersonii.AAC.1